MNVKSILERKGREVVTVLDAIRVEDAVRIMDESRIGAVVVLNDAGDVRGILSERDVMHRIGRDGVAALWGRVSECMTERLQTCSESDNVDKVLGVMTERRIRHLPVMRDGAMVGMISIGDLVKARIDEVERDVAVMMEYVAG